MGKEFDELSKALASGVSRRRALRRFVGGVAGAALAGLLPWRANDAVAKGDVEEPNPGNSVCAKLCKEYFPPGAERGRCISASAKCPPGSCAAIVVNNVPVSLRINDTEPLCLPVGVGPCHGATC